MVAVLRGLFRLVAGAFAAIIGLYLAFWVALFAFMSVVGVYNWLIANPRYAARMFDGVVPYSRVIASRQWHPAFGWRDFNCTFAVVELDATAPVDPPETDNEEKVRNEDDRQAWQFRFAGDWKPTPALDSAWILEDGMEQEFCRPHPGEEVVARLREAAAMPGGWYHSTSEVLVVYSKPAGLAFLFRSGD